jgi:DNA-binding transcriptional LysR family regulator
MERVLNLMGRGLVGELRVGAEPMVIHELIARVLAEFSAGVPDVRIALSDVSPTAVLDGVASGQFDIGCIPFAADVIAEPVAERFEWIRLSRIDIKLAVPSSRAKERHPDGRGWGRWIVPNRLPGLPGMFDAVDAELAGDPRFDLILVSNPQTAIPLVAAGLGVAPSTTRVWSQHPGVTVLEAPPWLKPMQVTLVLRKGAEVTPLMARWIDLARAAGARD